MARLPDTIAAGPAELRRWRPHHVAALVEAVRASLPGLRAWMPWAGDPVTVDAYAAVLRSFEAGFDAGTEFVFGLFEPGQVAVVGGAGVHFRHGPGVAEIGYWVRTDRWRRGYATAAAGALTGAAFRYLPEIAEVRIRMDAANAASAGVPAKLGYLLAAEEEREVLAPAETARGLCWVVTREAWPADA